MRYALVNGEKQGATKGEKGLCLCCGRDVIAKCGEIRCNHWAHKTLKNVRIRKKNLKPDGIWTGRIIFRKNGRKSDALMNKLVKFTSPT